MRKFFSSKSAFEVALVSSFALLLVTGAVLAATTIGTNITTAGSLYASSTLYVDGVSTFGDDMSLVTASSTGTVKFPTIHSDTGTIILSSTASTTGAAILKTATINSDTGAISFTNENLTTTGNIAFATASSTGAVQLASISSTAASISFSSKNLTSVLDIAFATASSTGAVKFANIGSTTGTVTISSTNTTVSGTFNVSGMATTTVQGIIIPNATTTVPTAYCGASTNVGGLLWVTTTKRLCVCNGVQWELATSTGACE